MRIDEKVRECERLVETLHAKARELYPEYDLPTIAVWFRLSGQCAGQGGYFRKEGAWGVNFNRRLMQDNWEDYLQETIAHEVAHVVVDYIAWKQRRRSNGHGYEWRRAMHRFGYNPERTHNYDITATSHSKRHAARFKYICSCNTYHLSFGKHKKEMVKPSICPLCDQELKLDEA